MHLTTKPLLFDRLEIQSKRESILHHRYGHGHQAFIVGCHNYKQKNIASSHATKLLRRGNKATSIDNFSILFIHIYSISVYNLLLLNYCKSLVPFIQRTTIIHTTYNGCLKERWTLNFFYLNCKRHPLRTAVYVWMELKFALCIEKVLIFYKWCECGGIN